MPSSAKACPRITPPRPSPLPSPRCSASKRADRFFAATGADIRHGGTRAYYAEGPDYVQMPPFETFRDAESYAATLAHELTHWTKHDKRLARDMGRVKWGDEGYAREELVAELGAAFLCADLGITPEVREDHAAYIASLAEGAAGRQAPDLHRRRACAARRGLSAQPATRPGRDRSRSGPPHRRPLPGGRPCPCPASSTSTAAAICGATWWRCAAARRRRAPSSRPCSSLREDHRPPGERNAAERYERTRACSPSSTGRLDVTGSPSGLPSLRRTPLRLTTSANVYSRLPVSDENPCER